MIKFVITILLALILSACSTQSDNIKKNKTEQPNNKSGKSMKTKTPADNSTCYEFGFKWGVCAAKNTEDRSCIPGKDAAIPENCMDDPITQEGIKEGIRSTQKGVQQ